MSFGSRRFLGGSGRFSPPTLLEFVGAGANTTTQVIISNDVNGNTVLGNGTFNTNTHLRTNLGTGGFANAPMLVELNPGRVYTIKILKQTTGTIVPRVETNVAATTATLNLRYARLRSLNNPPELYIDTRESRLLGATDIGDDEPEYLGANDGSGNPTPAPARFTFEDAGWNSDNELIVATGMNVPTTDSDLGWTGTNHTAFGLVVNHSVAQSSSGGSARMIVSLSEGYF